MAKNEARAFFRHTYTESWVVIILIWSLQDQKWLDKLVSLKRKYYASLKTALLKCHID
jgi:hypothetical protein